MVTVGQLVAGRYRVVHPLAAGGMGGVWLAVDEDSDEPVALKKCVLPDGLTPDEQDLFRVWVVREAREFALVGHPNVVRMLDVLPDDDAPWIVMEYVPSRSLQEVLDDVGPLPPARVAGIGLAVLEALLAVRRAGLLHLDVKPGNVLIGTDGRVVLSDFGPAVTAEGVRALAGAGIILGSPKYLAPERLYDGIALPESDLWSLGATLYHAVEGRPPYVRASTPDLLLALARDLPDPPQQAGPLTALLVSLLRRDPTARPDPEEVLRELRSVVSPAPDSSPPERPALPAPARPLLRRRFAVLATLVGVLVALVVGVVVMRPDGPSSQARAAISRDDLPAGYGWVGPGSGAFRLAVPRGWAVTFKDDSVEAVDNEGPRQSPRLRVTVEPTPNDGLADFTGQEAAGGLTNYRRLRIEQQSDPRGAIWEFTYDDAALGPVRALRRTVIKNDGVTYVLDWRTERNAWAVDRGRFDTIFGTFTARGGD